MNPKNRLIPYPISAACVVAVLSFAATTRLPGQTAPAPQPAIENQKQEEVMVLSPFVVDASQDNGAYLATSTLAGTRVKTDLNDIASSLSVITAQFLRDTGATNNQSLLVYTTNTEVAGIYGNYGNVGNTYVNGAGEPDLLRPSANNRVRGLDSADNTRDYFLTDIPWDSFNVDRVDLQRGPNSILFGIGSPAGIINASVNMATFKEAYKLESRFGSFGSTRNSLDFNKVLIDQQLAIRFAALDDGAEYRQRPAFNHDRRLFGAVRWDPKLFKSESAHTSIRVNFEHGDVTANRPRELPPTDLITPFFNGLNKTAYDPYFAVAAGDLPSSTGTTVPLAGQSLNFWLGQGADGVSGRGGPLFYYEGSSSAPLGITTNFPPGGSGGPTVFGIGPDGAIDSAIDGFGYATYFGITGYGQHALNNNLYNPNDPTTKGAASGVYKDKTLTDPSIFDFYNHLLGGSNQGQWQGWDAFNLVLDQTFFNNRLGFQVAYDYQRYHDRQEAMFSNAISVDVMANSFEAPWPYSTAVSSYNGSGTPGTNPNAGRAYVVGNGTGSSSNSTRRNLRVTGTGELRATDFMSKSWLSNLLGRHVFTGLYSKETHDSENRSYNLQNIDLPWPDATGIGPSEGGSNALSSGDRNLNLIAYISEPLFGASSASGLHVQPVTANYSPSGPVNVSYYDAHWKPSTNPADPSYVDPAAAWTNPQVLPGSAGSADSTQSENPSNYVGWKNGSFNILNANQGDINSLYTAGSKFRTVTDSRALTWQGYLWDDALVATLGWRRDAQKQQFGVAPISDSLGGAASMSYGLQPLLAANESTGNSTSWGLVLHEPKAIRDKLPWGTNISLTFSDGNNTRVEARHGFDGSPLPNAQGATKDYGFVIRTLNDRLSLKVTWYKTTVKNANMSDNPAASVFGANSYYLNNLEMWGLADALTNLAGMAGKAPAQNFIWDYKNGSGQTTLDPNIWTDPTWQNDPATLKEKAASQSFLSQLQPQSWWNAYGYPVNVANAKAGNWNTAIANWDPTQWIWGTSVGNGGLANGTYPTGTIDDQSKGVELELTGQVTKNWNVSVNASKQTADQIALGQALVQFVEAQYAKFQSPAGDLRLWSGGDMNLRQYYQANIYATFQFLQGGNGRLVPEMAPWRFNAVTDYAFDRGLLKGFNVGLGYRWQQGAILGYGLNADYSNLDIDKPFWGKSTDAVDLWIGYEHKLSSKVNWRIQLNMRSVGTKAHLEPVSVEPDGTPALERIVEGQTWFLTNTISF